MANKSSLDNILTKLKVFVDGADIESSRKMIELYNVKGFTTNPSLMRKAGITNYEDFAKKFVLYVNPLPVSLEVFADDPIEMERQAKAINSWGKNIYVKIPITNTEAISMTPLISRLDKEGIKVNATAVFTKKQIDSLYNCFNCGVPSIVSIFAGRIADAGQDPSENIRYAVEKFRDKPNVEILWASTREVYNVVQASNAGAHIITIQNSLIPKLSSIGKNLEEFSKDTVIQFRRDALESEYVI